jgi:hypothetical protein
LIFSRPIFLEIFLKINKLWWYEPGNGKRCELHYHLNVFFLEKSLDSNCKNGLSPTLFG